MKPNTRAWCVLAQIHFKGTNTPCVVLSIHSTEEEAKELADDGANPPYKVQDEIIVSPGTLSTFGVSMYGPVCTELMQKIVSIDLTPPDKCECQSREWLEAHPDDIQEYWRTTDGRIYAKDHTNLCPKNPKNRSKHD